MIDLIIIKGMTQVGDMRFNDIEGGFGPGKKAILAKDIAQIHNREFRAINQAINMNRKRFKDGLHILDLKGTESAINLVDSEIFTQNAMNAANSIYLLSERGYAVLLKILEDDVAWAQYEKLVDGYFSQRAENKRVRTKPVDTVFRQRLNMARDYSRVTGIPLKTALIIGINDAERVTGEDYSHWKDLVLTMTSDT